MALMTGPTDPTLTPDKPNIVMLMVDQWRADCFGALGHPVVETPNLDELFARGTIFERAYASVPSCIAARAGLLTGWAQHRHGRVGYQADIDWKYPHSIATELAAAGYLCHAIGKMHFTPPRRRLGFHDVELHDGYLHDQRRRWGGADPTDDYLVWLREQSRPDADITDAGLGCNGYDMRPWPTEDRLHPNSWTITRAVDFLRRRDPTMPFFLKVSFHRPHPPIDPPGWAVDRYRDRNLPDPISAEWDDRSARPRAGEFVDSPVPTNPAAIDRARRGYFAQITAIDHEINRLLQSLDEHRLLDSTAFVLVGDHGEMLFDHWRVGKTLPYEPSARVPLMLKMPGTSTVERCRSIVELRDVLPTLCEIAQARPPSDIDGSSLMPLALGTADSVRDILHGEHFNWGMADQRDDNQWLVDDRYKYVWFTRSGREQLFDLVEDPHECNDLAPDGGPTLDRFRGQLAAALEGREEGYSVGGDLIPGQPGRATLESSGLMSDAQLHEQRERVAALYR